MPYINRDLRPALEQGRVLPKEPGELNYMITKLVDNYLKQRSQSLGVSYALLNEVKGILDEVKDEFRERIIKPYEARKKQENGDVYTFQV